MQYLWLATVTLLVLTNCLVRCHEFKGFDDNILFALNWPGAENTLQDFSDSESIVVTSHNQEKYQCYLPKLPEESESDLSTTVETSALDYLEPLFVGDICSYRIETYWTYEICHGNYIKQYHEERDGKTSKLQEYYLGKWTKDLTAELRKFIEANKNQKLNYKKIDGLNLPYFEVEMVDGTLCDLNNEPRTTKVQYVCYAHGKNEIYTLKETSTCNYEIVVLTPNLCLHPKYKIQETKENGISCIPLEGAPKKPKSLLTMEVESMKLRYQKLMDVNKGLKDAIAVFKYNAKDGKLTMELVDDIRDDISVNKIESIFNTDDGIEKLKQFPPLSSINDDISQVKNFLEGKNCLTGGTGWWKYEFCYGKYVRQFHVDKYGSKSSIILGVFDEKLHKDFIDSHPDKKPKLKGPRKQITHFYAGGSTCDKTGQQRQTEVALICPENISSRSSVSLYLLEPKVCNYILGVESPIICDILHKVDDYGLVDKSEMASDSSISTNKNSENEEVVVSMDEIEIRFQNN